MVLQSSTVKKRIRKNLIEFYNSYNFKKKDTISFVDGTLMVEYTHKVIEKKNPRKGITELRYIDPQKIKSKGKISKPNPITGVEENKR